MAPRTADRAATRPIPGAASDSAGLPCIEPVGVGHGRTCLDTTPVEGLEAVGEVDFWLEPQNRTSDCKKLCIQSDACRCSLSFSQISAQPHPSSTSSKCEASLSAVVLPSDGTAESPFTQIHSKLLDGLANKS